MEEAWEFAVVSSIIIIAEALEELVKATDYHYEEFAELENFDEVSFEAGLEFSLKKVFPNTPETAENFMLNLMLAIDDAEKKINFASLLKENRRKFFVRKLSKLKRTILYPTTGDSWSDFCTKVCTEELLEDLKFIGEAMEEGDVAVLINDHVDEITKDVADLIKKVRASKISKKTKLAVLSQLETIALMMQKYVIFGADRMEGSLKTLLAETLINYKELTEDESNLLSPLHTFISKNLARMRSISSNIEAAKTIVALLESSQK